MGKYLNGYTAKDPVPPGWDEWHLSGNGYTNMPRTYKITGVRQKGGPKNVTSPQKHYLNDLLGVRARKFVNRAHDRDQPFFLTLSTFAPHQRIDGGRPVFPAARRDRPEYAGGEFKHGDCGTRPNGTRYHCVKDVQVKRNGSFTDAQYERLNKQYRDRVRMMQSLNDQMKKLRSRLRALGELDNTYFVFASDNGYHLGEHGFFRGKGTPYDHDTRVPLIIEGPGIKNGQVRHEITQTVDLYATFQQLARRDPKPSNGHGLMALLRGESLPHWRHAALFEHKPQVKKGKLADDPDLESNVVSAAVKFNPAFRAYKAIRTKNWLYVRYASEPNALYDLRNNPGQTKNVIGSHPRKAGYLRGWLARYAKCGKPNELTCWKASHAPPA